MSATDRPYADVLRQAAKRSRAAMAIVDRDCRVYFDTFEGTEKELNRLCNGLKLDPSFEALVRRLIVEGGFDEDQGKTAIALFGSSSFVRIHTIRDARAPFSLLSEAFLVTVEAMRNRNEITEAARRFRLTQRETEVLSLIMYGDKASDIARTLNLAEGTVQNYYKRLLAKTNARNRAAMVAVVLGWKQSSFGTRTALRNDV